MGRRPDPSDGPSAAFALGHVLALGMALGLFAVGAMPDRYLLGLPIELGDEARRGVLAACAIALFYRAHLTIGVLRWRPMTWKLAVRGVLGATALQVGFAWSGASSPAPLGGWSDRAGMTLLLLGLAVCLWSDLVRARAFAATSGRSALCTAGPFAFARHPDFLANLVWWTGWALLTRSRWAVLLPLAGAALYVAASAGDVERYLEDQEPGIYRAWARRTKRFIPFLY